MHRAALSGRKEWSQAEVRAAEKPRDVLREVVDMHREQLDVGQGALAEDTEGQRALLKIVLRDPLANKALDKVKQAITLRSEKLHDREVEMKKRMRGASTTFQRLRDHWLKDRIIHAVRGTVPQTWKLAAGLRTLRDLERFWGAKTPRTSFVRRRSSVLSSKKGSVLSSPKADDEEPAEKPAAKQPRGEKSKNKGHKRRDEERRRRR